MNGAWIRHKYRMKCPYTKQSVSNLTPNFPPRHPAFCVYSSYKNKAMPVNRFQYTVTEQDFLDFQLYTAMHSQSHSAQRNRGRTMIFLAAVMTAYTAFRLHNYFLMIPTAFLLVWVLVYPRYYKQRIKSMYRVHNREQLSARFGETGTIELKDGWIYSHTSKREFNADLSTILRIDETQRHFFIRFIDGFYIFFSKERVDTDPNDIRKLFEEAGLRVNILKNTR